MPYQCTFCAATFHCARDLEGHYQIQHPQSMELSRLSYRNELSLSNEITMLLRTMVDFSRNPHGQIHVELMEVFLDLVLQLLNRLRNLISISMDYFHQRWQRYH